MGGGGEALGRRRGELRARGIWGPGAAGGGVWGCGGGDLGCGGHRGGEGQGWVDRGRVGGHRWWRGAGEGPGAVGSGEGVGPRGSGPGGVRRAGLWWGQVWGDRGSGLGVLAWPCLQSLPPREGRSHLPSGAPRRAPLTLLSPRSCSVPVLTSCWPRACWPGWGTEGLAALGLLPLQTPGAAASPSCHGRHAGVQRDLPGGEGIHGERGGARALGRPWRAAQHAETRSPSQNTSGRSPPLPGISSATLSWQRVFC